MILILVIVFQVLGLVSAVHSIMSVRTPQGSIAWAVSLVAVPYIAVPAYWVFGRNKFNGYVLARKHELESERADAEFLGALFEWNWRARALGLAIDLRVEVRDHDVDLLGVMCRLTEE